MQYSELVGAIREQRAAYLEIRNGEPNNLGRDIQRRFLGTSAPTTVADYTPVEGKEEECGVRTVPGARETVKGGTIDP